MSMRSSSMRQYAINKSSMLRSVLRRELANRPAKRDLIEDIDSSDEEE
jgi:hypothetical protein